MVRMPLPSSMPRSNSCIPDSSQVDFTNPESFFHDVNSVAGLLKQFLRDLPDPLFTSQYYADFINAARKYLVARKPRFVLPTRI